VSPLRNAVLAHAGYGVIPATSFESALKILRRRACVRDGDWTIHGNAGTASALLRGAQAGSSGCGAGFVWAGK
jgi:hypothetical protein